MAKELYKSVELARHNQPVPEDALNGVLDRILKYDNFLNMSSEDLS